MEESDWEEIIENLAKGKVRDIGEEFLLNAKYMKSVRRYDAVVILCAVACEYKVRHCCDVLVAKKHIDWELWETLVKNLRPRVMVYYNKILPQLASSTMTESSNDKIKKLPDRLEDLFEDRNRIMHTGYLFRGTGLTADQVIQRIEKHIETTELVLDWLDSQIK